MPSVTRSKTNACRPSSQAVQEAPARTSKPAPSSTPVRPRGPGGPHPVHGVRNFGLVSHGTLQSWYDELDEMREVLLGREPPPIDAGVMTLMEVADAYLSRAKEIEQMILRMEAEGSVLKGARSYKFRTGELRSFIEMVKSSTELGSRRVTALRLELDMEEG